MDRIRLLWIEDETNTGLVERKTWLELCDDIYLTIAGNATEGHHLLQAAGEFDVIIIDIRLPPGTDELYRKEHYDGNERLGIILLEEVSQKEPATLAKIGIFSVEREADLQAIFAHKEIKMPTYMHKGETDTTEKFETYIKNIYRTRIK